LQFLIDVGVDPDLFALSLFITLPDLNKNPKHPAKHYLSYQTM